MKKGYNGTLYKVTRFVGGIVRNKTKKNPLDSIGKVPAFIYEKTMDKALDRVSFSTVRAMGYRKGDNPILGSIGYTVTRIVLGLLAFVVITTIVNLV